MIVVDTSALMAIVMEEPTASCSIALAADPNVLISAGTLTEALIVAPDRNLQRK